MLTCPHGGEAFRNIVRVPTILSHGWFHPSGEFEAQYRISIALPRYCGIFCILCVYFYLVHSDLVVVHGTACYTVLLIFCFLASLPPLRL